MRTAPYKPELEVIYDSECPICQQFACSIQGADNVTLIDGRKPSELLDLATSCHLDVDRGSIVRAEGKLYYGAEAFQFVAQHIKGKGIFGFISAVFFRHKIVANSVYPIFLYIRKLLLKVLKKPLIHHVKVTDANSNKSCLFKNIKIGERNVIPANQYTSAS